MQYHLVLTQRCNLSCDYCGSNVDPRVMPKNLDYSLGELEAYFSKLPETPVIAFYGGEPMINWEKMVEIMNRFDTEFMLQTNGTLIHKLPPKFYPKLNSVLVSIDGRPYTTDLHRGNGVFQRALNGARRLREHGYSGDLVARMTVTPDTDIYVDVKYLVEHERPKFDHVHWQLDVMWDNMYEERKHQLEEWLLHRYNPRISSLVEYWVNRIETEHQIPGIAPFMGITHSLLTGIPAPLRCGAGRDFFSITTDGRITLCPILPSVSFAVVGDIYSNHPLSIADKVGLEDPCTNCNVHSICGGRCLYTNKTKYWGNEGYDLVCNTVKHLIHTLETHLSRVSNLIRDNILSIDEFRYPVVPNGVETIP